MFIVMKSDQYQLQSLHYMERIEEKRTHIGPDEKIILFKIITSLTKHKCSGPFLKPVDYVKLQLPDYPTIIQQPMDLQTVLKKLEDYKYKHAEECLYDLLLIWENCRSYNPVASWIVAWANEMETYQKKMTRNYLPAIKLKKLRKRQPKDQKQEKNNDLPQNQVKVEACKQEVKLKKQQEVIQSQIKIEAPLSTITQLTQSPAIPKKMPEAAGNSFKQSDPSVDECFNKWELFGHSIREDFLMTLNECNQAEVTLIFMMIKRRCFKCIDFDPLGNATINLSKIDDYTLALAKSQIQVWKNNASRDYSFA